MFNEDNNGFVFFPFGNRININEGDKTLIYLIAFDIKSTILSNVSIIMPGSFVAEDILDRNTSENTIDNNESQKIYDKIYFPNVKSNNNLERMTSLPMVSSICIGWSNNSYEYKDGIPWKATYRDLTEEGKRLYYSIKKLHNNKEVRILTFNNI